MIELIQIHIANNCTGMAQQTKNIKPQQYEAIQDLETIRTKIKRRYQKRGESVEVFFVYIDNNQPNR